MNFSTKQKRLKNSIRAYIMGDALGVPFEFRAKGTFKCQDFIGFGTYQKPAGTWSDDTTVLLCLMNAIISNNKSSISSICCKFKDNLRDWYYKGWFTVDGLFDIGNQTTNAILCDFETERTDRMGNGGLFYSLPLSCVTKLNKKNFEKFCSITHNNKNCYKYGFEFALLLKQLIFGEEINLIEKDFFNRGDVINTFNLVCNNFLQKKDRKSTLFEDLCDVINLGEDTDTNAALFGALIGTVKPVDINDWMKVRKYKYLDKTIDEFVDIVLKDK